MKKNKQKSFSVIVPIYNCEKYIDRCVTSILNQTYDNFEIILINDCSTDNSLVKIKELSKNDSRIKVIDLPQNKGVSNARNIGIEKSINEYIVFCDTDDWYEEDALEKFNKAIEDNESDFVVANYYVSYSNNKKIKVNNNYYKDKLISKEEIICSLPISSCSKAIKRELFIKNKIKYPIELKRCEELEVIPILALYAKNPVFIDEYLYNYYQRTNSASNTRTLSLDFIEKSFNSFKKNIPNIYKEEIEFRAIEHVLYGETLLMLKNRYSKNEIINFVRKFKSNYPKYINNSYLKNYDCKKKIFIKNIYKENYFIMKLFAYIHSKLTC